jgi:hypothetical protein
MFCLRKKIIYVFVKKKDNFCKKVKTILWKLIKHIIILKMTYENEHFF